MLSKSFLDCERNSFERMKNYQLPHVFKKIGTAIAVLSFLGLFANKFTVNSLDIRTAVKYGLLVGLLIVSVSKEKIEDEFLIQLRMQSYSFAFIMGVVLTLFSPFADFIVDMVAGGQAAVEDMGDFETLWILLSVQVFCFEILKRMYR